MNTSMHSVSNEVCKLPGLIQGLQKHGNAWVVLVLAINDERNESFAKECKFCRF